MMPRTKVPIPRLHTNWLSIMLNTLCEIPGMMVIFLLTTQTFDFISGIMWRSRMRHRKRQN